MNEITGLKKAVGCMHKIMLVSIRRNTTYDYLVEVLSYFHIISLRTLLFDLFFFDTHHCITLPFLYNLPRHYDGVTGSFVYYSMCICLSSYSFAYSLLKSNIDFPAHFRHLFIQFHPFSIQFRLEKLTALKSKVQFRQIVIHIRFLSI